MTGGGAVRSRAAWWLLLALAAGCGRGPGPAAEPPAPERRVPLPTRQPFVRVGVAVGVDSVLVGSPAGLVLRDPMTGVVARAAPGETLAVREIGAGVAAAGTDGGPRRTLLAEPTGEDAGVTLDGRTYRGTLELYRVERHGLVAVNQLPLEAYLLGVVPLEIGPREPSEQEAVKAQAVAARTYAVRNLGRRDSLGFDVFGDVEDQVYGGRGAEREEASRAVEATAGEVLAWRGAPARAYYHSTGGGHTARVSDVWELPDAPYLRRVSDRRPGGGDFCEISPRYAWEEAWTGPELTASVAAGVERRFGVSAPPGPVTGVRVVDRAPYGRITELEVRTEGGRWVVTKNDIRFFLRTADGRPLRSTRFDVVSGGDAEEGLRIRGRGYGHGIGMCQWGAIGRARAGRSYREILSHYYPGTSVLRTY